MVKIIFILSALLFMMSTLPVDAQRVVSPAGKVAAVHNIQLSWTIGEPLTKTFTSSNTILNQGFQQGNIKITSIESTLIPGVLLSVYPNPVNYELVLEITAPGNPVLEYQLFNPEGKQLIQRRIEKLPQQIDVQNYTPGTYLLKIIMNGLQMKSYKIVKY